MRGLLLMPLLFSCVCAPDVPEPDGGPGPAPMPDAGRDAGPRPRLNECDAGHHFMGGQCTVQCAPCIDACVDGARCTRGYCVESPAACSGRQVQRVTLALSKWPIAWRHDVTRDGGTIVCTAPDGGSWTLDAGAIAFEAFDEASCLRNGDLISGSCLWHAPGVAATFDGDGGFEYEVTAGRQPRAEFVAAAEAVMRQCAPVFRDAGGYPFTW